MSSPESRRPLTASIIAVGSEMLGTTRLDTNSLKITSALESHAVALLRKSVVGDHLDDLVAEIRFAVGRSDLVIMTGGLGPTDDDLTREALTKALQLEMEIDESIVEKIAARFAARGWKMPEVNKRQANVFRGQTTLYNERGTAPGFHLDVEGRHLWIFPGVPHELEWMIPTYLVPWLDEQSGGRARYRRIMKVAGITESGVQERLKPYYDAHPGELVTILASPSGIEIHMVVDGEEAESKEVLRRREAELVAIFGDHVFGFDDATLEGAVGRLLTERKETLATAESCTGGLLSMRITDVAGSSAYYVGGAIAYDRRAKVDLANVDPGLIERHGEVSEEVAVALARGIRERFDTTYGIGITGIAGPGGGTPDKPVGTVHIAVATRERVEQRKMFWQGTRPIIRWYSSQLALDLLRKMIGQAR